MADFTDSNDSECAAANVWCLLEMEWGMNGTLERIEEPVIHECRASCMEERTDWHYWKMPCGHIYHTRCLEMHLYIKKKLNCCLCGDLTPKLQYCDFCKETNHYKYKSMSRIGSNDCFLNEMRRGIIKEFQKKGIAHTYNDFNYYSKKSIDNVIRLYKKLSNGDKVDWRKELSLCNDCTRGCEICS